jgi:NAD(P)-dependent dehydrogenase (short-subunit alcohol dehydrogenase family)
LPETWADEVAVVTGAAGSIGAAIADHLAALGARVAG